MTGHVRKFEGNASMFFKISKKQLLKNYNQIWKKVKSLLNIRLNINILNIRFVYGDNDKYIKTKIKTYGGSVITNTITLYPQTLLEECKYEPKKIEMENLIDDDLEKSSSDESDSEADNDSNDETESDDDIDNNESNE